jgi:hypothetical protein
MYNLHYVPTTLGVREIISGGTRTRKVEYHCNRAVTGRSQCKSVRFELVSCLPTFRNMTLTENFLACDVACHNFASSQYRCIQRCSTMHTCVQGNMVAVPEDALGTASRKISVYQHSISALGLVLQATWSVTLK